jgi:asparagine synthase (glutamine-hydrolysing)
VATAPGCDLAMFLPENILAYTDVGSMAESLEVRVPFLDPDLAYSALQQLTQRDLSFRHPKASLRRLFASQLPPHVTRARKRGFNPPLAPWLRGELGNLLTSSETAAFRKAFVNEAELQRMRDLHRDGVEDFSQELLSVIVAGTWYERWR